MEKRNLPREQIDSQHHCQEQNHAPCKKSEREKTIRIPTTTEARTVGNKTSVPDMPGVTSQYEIGIRVLLLLLLRKERKKEEKMETQVRQGSHHYLP